ncbi:protein-disulfide reductase DsbD domain-containing protein [Rhizobium sp. 0TCS1.26]|uniref:protein-disulfide reductase DsbD domain-containing protein n=1 Tax=Rhizobium sp. 0TCS1.26 TaxID=3142623 RepID=UPI003D2E13FA
MVHSTFSQHLRSRLGICLATAALCLSASGSMAAMTAWAENEGGRMRIVALPPTADGTVRGALQIEPKSGWITYWKEPGQAGIPPKITLTSADGASITEIGFPIPKQFTVGDVRDIGYDHPVALPFTLKLAAPDKPTTLRASAFIGLCRNICIPFQADFRLELSAAGPLPYQENLILDEAIRHLPEKPSKDFAVTAYTLSDDRQNLSLSLKLPDETAVPQIFVAGPEGHVLLDQTNEKRSGDRYVVEMPVGKLPKNYDPHGKRWDILVVSGGRAMETSLAFE